MKVLEAADGPTGLEQAREARPDVVLLDVMMPVVDGWGVLQRLAQQGVSTKVIVLSAKASGADVARALELGALEYITKPFDPAALVLTVAHVLSSTPADLEAGRLRRLHQLTLAG
jgi:DNA-binding response OmpR family regulator